ncbi:MAG: class I SAM-dependent methyltransferase [Microcystis aeruginosa TA09]|nr:MAG: class I SAM-dependent methyltransferase [Microcystis aeruginosa TA09]
MINQLEEKSMNKLEFICPECQSRFNFQQDKIVCTEGHEFLVKHGIYDLLPKATKEIVKQDAIYHGSVSDLWLDLAQLETLRNLHFHQKIVNFIANHSQVNSTILELGGGIGFDLELFIKTEASFKEYVFSEVAEESLFYVLKKHSERKLEKIIYARIDAHHIPFADESFDIVYMIAALHHLHDLNIALQEMKRVLKPNGFLIFGIEPNININKLLSSIILRSRNILPDKEHSPADEEAEGFSLSEFNQIAKVYNLELVSIEPVWLTTGITHYALEFIYRLLRLKKRIKLPFLMEKLFLVTDSLLFLIPGMSNFSWHYTVIYKKN